MTIVIVILLFAFSGLTFDTVDWARYKNCYDVGMLVDLTGACTWF